MKQKTNMPQFISDNLLKAIENGANAVEHPLWAHRTEDSEYGEIYWLGATPAMWLVVANVLYEVGNESKALAEAIAHKFGFEKNE